MRTFTALFYIIISLCAAHACLDGTRRCRYQCQSSVYEQSFRLQCGGPRALLIKYVEYIATQTDPCLYDIDQMINRRPNNVIRASSRSSMTSDLSNFRRECNYKSTCTLRVRPHDDWADMKVAFGVGYSCVPVEYDVFHPVSSSAVHSYGLYYFLQSASYPGGVTNITSTRCTGVTTGDVISITMYELASAGSTSASAAGSAAGSAGSSPRGRFAVQLPDQTLVYSRSEVHQQEWRFGRDVMPGGRFCWRILAPGWVLGRFWIRIYTMTNDTWTGSVDMTCGPDNPSTSGFCNADESITLTPRAAALRAAAVIKPEPSAQPSKLTGKEIGIVVGMCLLLLPAISGAAVFGALYCNKKIFRPEK